MCVELVNAILNIRTGLNRNNILKHCMIMTEIPEAVTIGSFIVSYDSANKQKQYKKPSQTNETTVSEH